MYYSFENFIDLAIKIIEPGTWYFNKLLGFVTHFIDLSGESVLSCNLDFEDRKPTIII